MQFERYLQNARCYASVAVKATTDAAREAGRFASRHCEIIAGSVGGYVAGRAIESIPFIGKLLKPIASIVLGIAGTAYGHQKSLERRRIEALERGSN